ncbi:MAG: glycosyltransferase family 2 protein, partial [Puniceicoccaceae bacterium]
MPVRNKALYLDRSIRSVINQRFTDFELLLIDDASTDGSLMEIQKIADQRIRVLHRDTPGPGGYAGRNLGVAEAKADWIAFLDADDEWYPEHLQNLYHLACQPNAQVLATGWFDIQEAAGEATPSAFSVHHAGVKVIHLDFSRFLEEYTNKRKPVWTGVMSMRGDLLKAIGGFPEHCRRGGDSATWLRIVAASGGIHVATARTAVYHREASGVIRALPPEVQRNCVYEATQELLVGIRSPRTRHQLMRVSNLHILPGLKSRAL